MMFSGSPRTQVHPLDSRMKGIYAYFVFLYPTKHIVSLAIMDVKVNVFEENGRKLCDNSNRM